MSASFVHPEVQMVQFGASSTFHKLEGQMTMLPGATTRKESEPGVPR
jgi:hypothetical protein